MDKQPWGLLRAPFCEQAVAAKPFLVNESFQQAYRDLLAATRAARGCLLLTGHAGLGKTTLLRYLLRGLPFTGIVVESFPPPQLAAAPASDALPPPASPAVSDPEAAWPPFCSRIVQRAREGRPIVLAVDDAHTLPDAVLLDMLSLRNTAHRLGVALTILMTGAPAFAARLAALVREAGCDIDVHARLLPLSEAEVAAYVAQALGRAGCRSTAPFPPESLARLAARTEGILAAVNGVCGHALAFAEAERSEVVTAEMIDRAAEAHAGEQRTVHRTAVAPRPVPAATPAADAPAVAQDAAIPVVAHEPRWHPEGQPQVAARPALAVAPPRPPIGLGETPLTRLPLLAPSAAAVPANAASSTSGQGHRQDRRPSAGVAIAVASAFVLAAGVSALAWQLLRPVPETTVVMADEAVRPAVAPVLPGPAATPAATSAAAPPSNAVVEAPMDAPMDAPVDAPVVVAPPDPGNSPRPSDVERTSPRELPRPEAVVAAGANRALPTVAPPPAPALAQPAPVAALPPAQQPPTEAPARDIRVAESRAQTPRASDAEIALMLARGDEMLAISDLVSARLFYARAAGQGSAAAMSAMAGTYDPQVLASHNVRGIRAEPREAIDWYRRALAAGDAGAGPRLNALVEEMRRTGALSAGEAAALLRPVE